VIGLLTEEYLFYAGIAAGPKQIVNLLLPRIRMNANSKVIKHIKNLHHSIAIIRW
jgi:hypothetical protein